MNAAALPYTISPRANVTAASAHRVLPAAPDQGGTSSGAPFTALLVAAGLPDAPVPALLVPVPGKILPLAPPDGSALPIGTATPEREIVPGPALSLPSGTASETGVLDDQVERDGAAGTLDEHDVEVKKSRLRSAPYSAALNLVAEPPAAEPLVAPVASGASLNLMPAAPEFAPMTAPAAVAASTPIGGKPVFPAPAPAAHNNMAPRAVAPSASAARDQALKMTSPTLASLTAAELAPAAPNSAVPSVASAAAAPVALTAAEPAAISPPGPVNAVRPDFATAPPQATVMPGPRLARRERGGANAVEHDRAAAAIAPSPPAAPTPVLATIAVPAPGVAPGPDLTTAKVAATIDRPDHHALVEAVARARGEPATPAVMLVRNPDFGPISIRLNAAGAELHAMLGSDDPDFRSSVIAAADQSSRPPAPAPPSAAALRDGSSDRPAGTGSGPSSGQSARHESASHEHLAGQQDRGLPDRHDRHHRHDPHRSAPTLAMIRHGRDDDASRLPRRDAGIFA